MKHQIDFNIIVTDPSDKAQLSAMARLHGASFDDAWSEEVLADLLKLTGTKALLYVEKGEPSRYLGFVLFRVILGEAEILTIASNPEHRRGGIASALLEKLLDDLMGEGCSSLVLEVSATNDAAIGLYRNAGFLSVGQRASYYRITNDQRQDALIMRRDLPQ